MDFGLFQKEVLVMASPIISGRYSINHALNNPPRLVKLFEYLLETFETGPIQQHDYSVWISLYLDSD